MPNESTQPWVPPVECYWCTFYQDINKVSDLGVCARPCHVWDERLPVIRFTECCEHWKPSKHYKELMEERKPDAESG